MNLGKYDHTMYYGWESRFHIYYYEGCCTKRRDSDLGTQRMFIYEIRLYN